MPSDPGNGRVSGLSSAPIPRVVTGEVLDPKEIRSIEQHSIVKETLQRKAQMEAQRRLSSFALVKERELVTHAAQEVRYTLGELESARDCGGRPEEAMVNSIIDELASMYGAAVKGTVQDGFQAIRGTAEREFQLQAEQRTSFELSVLSVKANTSS